MKITNQADATVTECEYNGLGHRIGHRWDTDGNASLEWQWYAYDDRWRIVAQFENGSAPDEPTEQIYHHSAGLNGQGGSSYIDLVICRDRDTDADPSDGMEERSYVLQNWRADVIALAAPDGDLLERISYDSHGIPFATHPTDLTLGSTSGVSGYGMPDGTLNNDDYFYFLILYGGTDHRADWDRDGDVDASDYTAYTTDKAAASGSWGRGVLSNRKNILGYAGYVHEPATGAAGSGHGTMYHCRLRVHHAGLGRWIQRDPPQFEYGEGMSLYWYGAGSPLCFVDPLGLSGIAPGPVPPGGDPDPSWTMLPPLPAPSETSPQPPFCFTRPLAPSCPQPAPIPPFSLPPPTSPPDTPKLPPPFIPDNPFQIPFRPRPFTPNPLNPWADPDPFHNPRTEPPSWGVPPFEVPNRIIFPTSGTA